MDLTKSSSNAINSFSTSGRALSAFNFLDQIDINIFYTSTVGSATILVSYFVFKVGVLPTADAAALTTPFSVVTTTDWNGALATYGDKIGHASTFTTGIVNLF